MTKKTKLMGMQILIYLVLLIVTFCLGNTVYAQSRDLCGGTGGNGEIVSIGNNTFTLKLNEGGNKPQLNGSYNLIVNLTSRATIETPTGNASLSDLKIGDRITLVGDNNRDGTFTADAVVVCKGNVIGQEASIVVRNYDTNYEKVSGIINVVTILILGLIWLGTLTYFRLRKRKSSVYLLFFTIFYVYLFKVLDYTLIQFQSLLLLQHFLPNLMLNGVPVGRTVNLIPLATLTMKDAKTSLLNILMMMPFGFGLPFITDFRLKKIVSIGLLVSVVIELLQFITGFMANMTFRIADLNDLIFNTIGVTIGYILFVAFVRICRRVSNNWKISANPVLQYIVKRPQISEQ